METTESEYTTLKEIREVVEWAAIQVGYPVEELIYLGISFNNRFTRRMGDASFTKGRIRFSGPLWPHATPEDRRETIVHEFCHIADRYFGNKTRRGHGPSWKRLMRQCGYAGDRCHTVNPPGMRRKNRGTKEYTCGCPGKTLSLGKKRATRQASAAMYGRVAFRCRQCGCGLVLKK